MAGYYTAQGFSQVWVPVSPKVAKKLTKEAQTAGLSRNALLTQIASDFVDDPVSEMRALYAAKDRERLRFWAPPPLYKRVKRLAEKLNVTMSVVMATAITIHIEDST